MGLTLDQICVIFHRSAHDNGQNQQLLNPRLKDQRQRKQPSHKIWQRISCRTRSFH
jgi:hypothetical protein